MSKIATIDAVLERDGQSTPVQFKCLLKSITVNSGVHVRYVIEKSLGFVPGTPRFPDANYTLKYTFEGQPTADKVHIVSGTELMGGWL